MTYPQIREYREGWREEVVKFLEGGDAVVGDVEAPEMGECCVGGKGERGEEVVGEGEVGEVWERGGERGDGGERGEEVGA